MTFVGYQKLLSAAMNGSELVKRNNVGQRLSPAMYFCSCELIVCVSAVLGVAERRVDNNVCHFLSSHKEQMIGARFSFSIQFKKG